MHVVGSRGDVQPFIALGQVLQNRYRHRVRLATHSVFQKLVEDSGLEFFSIGGDPVELMAFMVKNPGLLPSMQTLTSGEVGRRRKTVYEIMKGCWRSCFESGDGLGDASLKLESPSRAMPDGISSPTRKAADRLFVADVIIANPPSFAHIHCAQKLGIPLHLMFTYGNLYSVIAVKLTKVQNAVVTNASLSTSLGQHQSFGHRCKLGESAFVWTC